MVAPNRTRPMQREGVWADQARSRRKPLDKLLDRLEHDLMRRDRIRQVLTVVTIGGVGAIVGAGAYAVNASRPAFPALNENAAAWVQAVGSIAAVLAAAAIAANEARARTRDDRRREAEEKHRRVENARLALTVFERAFFAYRDNPSPISESVGLSTIVNESSELIRAILLQPLPSGKALNGVLDMFKVISDMNISVGVLKGSSETIRQSEEYARIVQEADDVLKRCDFFIWL